MLRRKPTALTITTEDLAAFEESHARRILWLKYQKTGEDPQGLFTGANAGTYNPQHHQQHQYQQHQHQHQQQMAAEDAAYNDRIDPNDELKPLPGDKARIVRTREERIVGVATGGAAASGRR